MSLIDKQFTLLQIRNTILSAEGKEFQVFFENVMLLLDSDFQRITPNGNQGDGGNDGFNKLTGQYYQVYAPKDPSQSLKKAIQKYKEDFEKLKDNWGDFSLIREYIFVYNDKLHGSTEELQRTTVEMENKYPNIKFKTLFSDDFEKLVKSLSTDKLTELGFTVDGRESLKVISKYLELIDACLDEENTTLSLKLLNLIEFFLLDVPEISTIIEYKLIKAKYLRKVEKIDKSRKILLEIIELSPEAKLILAEIYLQEGNVLEFDKLLAEFNDNKPQIELYRVYELLFKINRREKIEDDLLNEENFPNDKKIRSNLFRLASIVFWEKGNSDKAKEFINKSLLLYPNRFSAQILSLSLNEGSINKVDNSQDAKVRMESLVESIESKFYHCCSYRGKIILESKKLIIFKKFEEYDRLNESAKYILQNIDNLYFDKTVDSIIQQVMSLVAIPKNDFENLVLYLYNSKKVITIELQRLIFSHIIASNFDLNLDNNTIKIIDSMTIKELLNSWDTMEENSIFELIKSDIPLALIVASISKDKTKLRKKLIETLENNNVDVSRLKFLLSIDNGDINEAQIIFSNFNLEQLSVVDLQNIYSQIRGYDSPSFNSIVLLELISRITNTKAQLQYRVHLFFAYTSLKKYQELIDLGNEILNSQIMHTISLDHETITAIMINTSIAYFERIKVDTEVLIDLERFIEKYKNLTNAYEFFVGALTEFYILKKEYDKAIDAIIEAVRLKKQLSQTDFAKLYMIFIKIGENPRLSEKSLNKVIENTFIFLSDNQWYYFGSGNALDTIPVESSGERAKLLKGVRLNQEIDFSTEFSKNNPLKVLKIYKIEQFIVTKVMVSFQQLAKKGLLDGVCVIDMKGENNNIDINNLQKFLKKQDDQKEPFFSLYLKNNLPLSFLAISEGGLINAIGKISTESTGFIHISSGSKAEMDIQLNNAKDAVGQNLPFVIDGLSALFLAESGLLLQVLQDAKNFLIPRSVIDFLIQTSDKLRKTENCVGYMYSLNDKMVFRKRDIEQDALLWKKLNDVIKYFESDKTRIIDIINIPKSNTFAEQAFPSEIVDACIISQNRKILLLTDDYLYLSVNKLQTEKESPSYFSSFVLIKALTEKKLIHYSVYLDYFAYLSKYRCRFLPVSVDEMLRAIVSGERIKALNIDKLMKFNLSLTLSEEYGINPEQSLKLVVLLINTLIFDESITKENLREIFIKIMNNYPMKSSKNSTAKLILGVCRKVLSNRINNSVIFVPNQNIIDRIEFLEESIDLYVIETNIIFPPSFSI